MEEIVLQAHQPAQTGETYILGRSEILIGESRNDAV